MKKKLLSLVSFLIITSLLLCGYGAYIKYQILAPYDLYQDKNIVELPFLIHTDSELKFMMQMLQASPQETEPTETEPVPTETEPEPSETEPLPVETEPMPTISIDELAEHWFEDALFVGNSLVAGLQICSELQEPDYFCDVGMSVFNARDVSVKMEDGKSYTLEQLLSQRSYGKIYIHMGTNEVSGDEEWIMSAYWEMIKLIRQYQPDALIIIHGMLSVSYKVLASHSYMHVANINSLNECFKEMTKQDKNMVYIDINPEITEESGYLPDSWTHDGYHPGLDGYLIWENWLRQNARELAAKYALRLPKILK